MFPTIFTFTFTFTFILVVIASPATSTITLPSSWYYLGPFLFGKTEVDGNPISLYGGLDKFFPPTTQKDYPSRINSKALRNKKIPSEAVPTGFVKWRNIQMQFASQNNKQHGQIIVQHQELAELQQHHLSQDSSALEFIGFAVTILDVPGDGVYVFECSGFHTLFFDDTPFAGDQFGRGYRTSVYLRKGKVRLSLRLRGNRAQASFQLKSISSSLSSSSSSKPLVTIHKHNYVPDVVCSTSSSSSSSASCQFYLEHGLTHAAVVIQSHYEKESIRNIRIVPEESSLISVLSVNEGLAAEKKLCTTNNDLTETLGTEGVHLLCDVKMKGMLSGKETTTSVIISPLHTRTVQFPLLVNDPKKMFEEKCSAMKKNDPEFMTRFKIFASIGDDDQEQIELGAFMLKFRCRKLFSQSFLITYRDFDGSPAQSGIILPPIFLQQQSTNNKEKNVLSFPIFLSLHGTGSSPTSQADAFKYKPANKNKDSDDYIFGVDGYFLIAPDRHGAHNWEGVGKLSALHAAFIVTANSIIISEAETSSFKHNQQHHQIKPDCRRIFAAGNSMGAHGGLILAMQHPSLIMGVAIQAPWIVKEFYGDSNSIFHLDRSTDHIFGTRTRRRMILEASIADNALQLENLLHVPVMIRTGSVDTTVSPFFARRLVRLLKEIGHKNVSYDEPKSKPHWWWDTKRSNDGGCVNDEFMRKFYAKVLEENNQQSSNKKTRNFTFVSHSPFTTRLHVNGVQIVEQEIPMQRSEITFSSSENIAEIISSENVKSYNINNQNNHYKKPFGPIRQYMEAPFVVGYLSSLSSTSSSSLLSSSTTPVLHPLEPFAKFLADASLVAFDSDVPVVPISVEKGSSSSCSGFDNSGRRKLVLASLDLLSNPTSQNKIFQDLFPFNVTITENEITFGSKTIKGTDLVLVTIFPRCKQDDDNSGGVLVLSQTMKAMKHVIHDIAMPTIPPMMRPPFGNLLPDFFISDASKAHTGYGSFVRGGYFTEKDFMISEDMSY